MTELVKQAGMGQDFINGALNIVKDNVNFNRAPFETLFSLLGPPIAYAVTGPFIGSLILAADVATNYGPSAIGRLIDQHLMSGKTDVTEIDFSDSNMNSASVSIVDKIWSKIKTIPKNALKQIMAAKGHISNEDVIASFYLGEYMLCKEAVGGGWLGSRYKAHRRYKRYGWGASGRYGRLRGFMSGMIGGRRLGFASIIFGIIKLFGKGIIAMMLAGGIAKVIGVKTRHERKRDDPATTGKNVYPGDTDPFLPSRLKKATMQYYSNVSGNVQDTLITFLDASIANFSVAFKATYKTPLRNSPQMQRVLQDVELLNWGNMADINKRKAFVAPRVLNLAKKLLPKARYEKIQSKPLGKKPAVNVGLGKSPGSELAGLLREVH